MFGTAISEEIKTKMNGQGRSEKEKRCIHNVICGQILKKYRLISMAKKVISLSHKRVKRVLSKTSFVSVFEHARKRKIGLGKTAELVKEFFLQDENSAPSSGVRETITRNKIKMQKRYLTDSLLNLHAKFRAEHSSEKISYTAFTRLRPFYCVYPSVNSRDTVKCKLHANIELKVNKLHHLGYLPTGNVTKLIPVMVCSETYTCMYGICEKCKNKVNDLVSSGKTNLDTVSYEEWRQVKEQRATSNGPISVSMMTKVTLSDTVANLCEAFVKGMRQFLPHQYRITHQYQAVRDIKNKIEPNECILQIDYSENYNCKAAVEVQGMHFGASRRQVSLHTCHCTLKRSTSRELYTKCFCTLSDDSRHAPSAVWAHLHPVLLELKNMGVDIIHFISDGPTTQYRNKTNFLLMSTLPFEKYGFKLVYWNLLESSHGKGPADGVGAAVKSAADNLVAHGQDILDVTKLYNSLRGTINVQLYTISSDDINNVEKMVNVDHDTVKGTMKIHQLVAHKYGHVSHRELSCYCKYNSPAKDACHCHNLVECSLLNATGHDMDEPVKPNPQVEAIGKMLSTAQIAKFEGRLAEGYDVTLGDLTVLSPEEKSEYLYRKSWQGAKLQGVSVSNDSTKTTAQVKTKMREKNLPSESDNEGEKTAVQKTKVPPTDSDTEDDDPAWEPRCSKKKVSKRCKISHPEPNRHNPIDKPESGRFYAVFFTCRSGKTFYIGNPLKQSNPSTGIVKMKFLERRGFEFDWPRTEDIDDTEVTKILCKVDFQGPPPFSLSERRYKEILTLAKNFLD